jgi:APA family basic amino acid/polyamine antiporter
MSLVRGTLPESVSATSDAPARSRSHLLRILGAGFGVAVILGGTIGSGILRTPGEIAARLGSPGWIVAVWLLGGAYALFCTVSVTELGTMLPFAGGWWVYSRRAFGDYAGFLVGCSDWMVQTVSASYLAVAFAEFAIELQPRLGEHVKLLGVGVLAVLMVLNWVGLRSGSRTQEVTSLIKALALLAFVAACFIFAQTGAPSRVSMTSVSLPLKGGLLIALVLSLQAVIVTYDGWYQAIYFMEEDKNPAANLPRSSIVGVFSCIAIFLLVNLALFHILPMSALSASQMPVADAAMVLFGMRGKQFILIVSLITAVSAINATVLSSPRILFAMARDGFVPGWVTFVNRGGTPTVALLIGTVTASVLVLSGSFETLIAIASILFVTVYLSGLISLFALRVKGPDLLRPFRAWAYPWGSLGVLLTSAAFLVGSIIADLKDALFTVVFIALTIPLYLSSLSGRRSSRAVAHETPIATKDSRIPLPSSSTNISASQMGL